MRTKLFFVLMISIVALCSCSESSPKETPQDVIKKYERLVLEMKADSISQLFTTDAEIGHADQPVVKGRDSIYSFLSKFKNVRVLNNRDQVDSVSIRNDSAIVNGVYTQTVITSVAIDDQSINFPIEDTINVAGKFTATMVRDKNNWLISRMKTRSN